MRESPSVWLSLAISLSLLNFLIWTIFSFNDNYLFRQKKKTQLLIILQSNLLALDVKPFISLVSFYNQVATNEWPKMTADILWKCLSLLVYGHVRVINVVTAGILIRACLLMRDLDINVICADSQWRFYCQRLASHHSFSSGG